MLQVDSREPQQIFDKLDKKEVEYEKKYLPVGDFVYNNIAFERKEIKDFLGSIMDSRVFEQVLNMKANYDKVYVIISGKFQDLFTGFSVPNLSIIYGAIASLSEKYDVKVLRVEDDNQLINQILKICEKSTQPRTIFAKRLGIKSEDIYISMLSCVPRISYLKASKILEKYKFVELFKVSKENLMEIPGVGDKLSTEIKNYFFH